MSFGQLFINMPFYQFNHNLKISLYIVQENMWNIFLSFTLCARQVSWWANKISTLNYKQSCVFAALFCVAKSACGLCTTEQCTWNTHMTCMLCTYVQFATKVTIARAFAHMLRCVWLHTKTCTLRRININMFYLPFLFFCIQSVFIQYFTYGVIFYKYIFFLFFLYMNSEYLLSSTHLRNYRLSTWCSAPHKESAMMSRFFCEPNQTINNQYAHKKLANRILFLYFLWMNAVCRIFRKIFSVRLTH